MMQIEESLEDQKGGSYQVKGLPQFRIPIVSYASLIKIHYSWES